MRLSVLVSVSLVVAFALSAGCGDDDSAAPNSSSSSTSSSGGTSGDVGTSSGGTSSGGTSSGGTSSGGSSFNPETKNAATYSFPKDETAWAAVAGTYKLDCIQAEKAPLVPGVGYAVLKADKTMTLLAADGSTVVTLDGTNSSNYPHQNHFDAASPNPEYWTFSIGTAGGAPTLLSLVINAQGGIDFTANDPGKNSGHCVSHPGQTLHYGVAVPPDFAGIAGTHKMAAPGGAKKYDLVIDTSGKVTVNQTDPASATNPVYTVQWTGGVQPYAKGTGDFVLWRPGNTDGSSFDLQIQNSAGGSEPYGFALSTSGGKVAYAASGTIVMNPAN